MFTKTEVASRVMVKVSGGYPDYEEIQDQRARRNRQEQEGGRQRVMVNMAQGLIERIIIDYGMKKAGITAKLDHSDADWRNWTVALTGHTSELASIVEPFHEFPSPELTTKLMLLGLMS